MYLTSQEKNALVSIVQHFVAGGEDPKNFSKERKARFVEALYDMGITVDELRMYCTQLYSFRTATQIIETIVWERRICLARSIYNTIKRVGTMGEWGLLIYNTSIFRGMKEEDIDPDNPVLASCVFSVISVRYNNGNIDVSVGTAM